MVFLCLLLSVFSTIQQYEEVAGIILYYTVSKYLFNVDEISMDWSANNNIDIIIIIIIIIIQHEPYGCDQTLAQYFLWTVLLVHFLFW